jgi:hypothetical protein
MQTMIEKMARALAAIYATKMAVRGLTAVPASTPFTRSDEYVEKNWQLFVDEARAVLEAMLDPTEKMRDAFHHHDETWEAAIRVALDEVA